MKAIQLISVIGASACSPDQASFAEQSGKLLAAAGLGIVCGGRGGVMQAACKGAWEAGGFTLGILPGIDSTQANPYLTVTLPSGLHEARNVLVVLAGEAVLAIGGGQGTLSEIAHAIRMGKVVVGYQTWEGHVQDEGELPILRVESPKQALGEIKRLVLQQP